MNNARKDCCLMALLMISAPAYSHDTWLMATRAGRSGAAPSQFELTSGMAFPALGTVIEPDRIEQAMCRSPEGDRAMGDIHRAPKALRLNAAASGKGISTCWVVLKPRALELNATQVKEYLAEIDAPADIRREWTNAKTPKRWREQYAKHAKTFVRDSGAVSTAQWADPVGMRLEIVPEVDPTVLRAGDRFAVRVLRNGESAAGFPLGIVAAGNHRGSIRKTDAEGRVAFDLNRSGRWLLRGTDLRKSQRMDLDWESDFTTLTFEVKPR